MTERYYAGEQSLLAGANIALAEDETHHLVKVMRQPPGSVIRLFAGGSEATGVFREVVNKRASIEITDVVPGLPQVRLRLHCLIPWIKGGRTELVLQKLTELGAASISIFASRREVVKGSDGKLERLRRVAVDACKQCERSDVPALYEFNNLVDAMAAHKVDVQQRLLLYERERATTFSDAFRAAAAGGVADRLVIASGPEGGFDPSELATVNELCVFVSLGPRILRAETAPIVAASAALALAGEL